MPLLNLAVTAALSAAALTASAPPRAEAGDTLAAAIGTVRCPERQVPVTVTNDTDAALSYELRQNGVYVREEQVPAGQEINGLAQLKEDVPTVITVVSQGRTLAKAQRTADCAKPSPTPEPTPGSGGGSDHDTPPPRENLPHTGPGSPSPVRALTALSVLAGGGILIFWGLLWPGTGRGDWSTPSRRTVL